MSCNELFPLFVSLEKKICVVIGGGTIATRRIKTLLSFGCDLTVIAPCLSSELEALVKQGAFCWKAREYQNGDCKDAFLAVAATDQREVNHAVYLECKEKNIFVSVADQKEECTFQFPAVVRYQHKKEETVVIGLNSGGKNHSLVRKTAEFLRKQLSKEE